MYTNVEVSDTTGRQSNDERIWINLSVVYIDNVILYCLYPILPARQVYQLTFMHGSILSGVWVGSNQA